MSNQHAPEAATRNGNYVSPTDTRSDFERLMDKPLPPSKAPTEVMADFLGVPRSELVKSLKEIVMPPEARDADYLAFCQVASRYRLNPFLREIYPIFSKKTGKMTVVVPIDGWVTIVQRERNYDGVEFREVADDDGDKPVTTFCTIFRKDRSHPTVIPERFAECYRDNSEPWRTMPFRMLRHKAFIQCARVAFGIGGIADEEEGAIAAGYESAAEALAESHPQKKQKRSLIGTEEPASHESTNPAGEPNAASPSPATAPAQTVIAPPAPGSVETKRRGRPPAVNATPPAAQASPLPIAEPEKPQTAIEKILNDTTPIRPMTEDEKAAAWVDEQDKKFLTGWILTMKDRNSTADFVETAIARHGIQGTLLSELPEFNVRAISHELKLALLKRDAANSQG